MRIMSASYFDNDGTKKEVFLRDVKLHVYKSELRGKLYCPMKDCPAKISYSGGKYPHFKTWRYDKHAVDCPFYFDRIPINLGRNTTETISVEISQDRRQNALDDAYRQMNLTEEEKENQRKSRNNTRTKSRKVTTAKINSMSVQQVLFDADFYEDDLIYRRRNISKRLVDEITETDLEKVLLVKGIVKNSGTNGEIVEIVVENNAQDITAIFEEAFTKEPLNKSYLNKFWVIKHLINQIEKVQFIGIGEIRKNRRSGRLELVIYRGADFRINNRDMSAIATQLTLERHRLGLILKDM